MNTLSFAREEWKDVDLGDGYTNKLHIQVSNFGRVRSFSNEEEYTILKGSMINGYRIIRLKMFKPRSPEAEKKFNVYQDELNALDKEIRHLRKVIRDRFATDEARAEATEKHELTEKTRADRRKVYSNFLRKETNKRTINFGGLVHRLVAEKFLTPESPEHKFVAHLDFDKLNNVVTNLKWMTKDENVAHQQHSPFVIERKKIRKENNYADNGANKLTLTKVMFLKKLLNEGKPIASLAKQFKVTETQIIRIKKNENWASVEAAK